MSTPDPSIRIHMTGSEWFDTLTGGLNRYFESLMLALAQCPGVSVSAAAFGQPRDGGASWGDLGGNLLQRTMRARRDDLSGVDVLDRHFAPYGPGHRRLDPGAVLVQHFQGPWFAESLAVGQTAMRGRLKHRWEAIRYHEAARLVVLCEEFGSILEREFSVPGERIAVIAPGVDLERFAPAPPVETDRPLVLCVRRLERRMGIDVLVEAWPDVLKRVPEARLGIVGEGRQAQALAEQCRTLGIETSVAFHGSVSDDELTRLYAESALTVVPTRELEGFGLIALESMAMARPVVVTRVGGLPDSVVGLDASLVVPPLDPQALAERLADGLEGRVPGPDACRAHAETFSWQRAAERHLALYREALA